MRRSSITGTQELSGEFSPNAIGFNGNASEAGTYSVLAASIPLNCDPEAEWNLLPEFGPHTTGRVTTNDGRRLDVRSGLRSESAAEIDWVSDKLRDAGRLKGTAKAGDADHAEQKLAAIMAKSKPPITDADIVINHPTGPCPSRNGCDDVLDILLKDVGVMRVHWKQDGVMKCRVYGVPNVRNC